MKIFDNNNTFLISADALRAITDGIFGVGMTMLALIIFIPDKGELSPILLQGYLHSLTYEVVLFALSFIILGSIWISERYLIESIEQTNEKLMWLTLIILMFAVLIPISLSLILNFAMEFPIFAYIFHLNQIVIGLLMVIQWYYIYKRNMQIQNSEETGIDRFKDLFLKNYNFNKNLLNIIFYPIIAFIALLISFKFPLFSNFIYILILFKSLILKIVNNLIFTNLVEDNKYFIFKNKVDNAYIEGITSILANNPDLIKEIKNDDKLQELLVKYDDLINKYKNHPDYSKYFEDYKKIGDEEELNIFILKTLNELSHSKDPGFDFYLNHK